MTLIPSVNPLQSIQALMFSRSWGEELLSEACRFLKEDVDVSPVIHGGEGEYRKTLVISFFFKFYMQVVLEMRDRVSKLSIMTVY